MTAVLVVMDTTGDSEEAYIKSLSEGQADVYNTNSGVTRVRFGVSDVKVDRRFDGAGHRLDTICPSTHLLKTGSDIVELSYTHER